MSGLPSLCRYEIAIYARLLAADSENMPQERSSRHGRHGRPDSHQIRQYALSLLVLLSERNHINGPLFFCLVNANNAAMALVKADKEREAADGHDGTWVAHPDLVPVAADIFNRVLGGKDNQVERQFAGFQATAAELISTPEGTRTEDGLRRNINVSLGNGAFDVLCFYVISTIFCGVVSICLINFRLFGFLAAWHWLCSTLQFDGRCGHC